MDQTREALAPNLADRLCGQVARRDDTRVARRLDRQPLGDGVYRLDEGALLDDFCHVLHATEVMARREPGHGTAIQRAMIPGVPYGLREGLKAGVGIDRMTALPVWLGSDEALMPWVGCTAQPVRPGLCPRGATTRQGARTPGPIGPETLAEPIVKRHGRALEAVCKGSMRAWATAGSVGAQVTGLADGTALETTERSPGWGQGTRQGRMAEQRGRVHALEVTVYGGQVLLRLDAATKMPLAVTVGKLEAPASPWRRALRTQARMHLAGAARRRQVVCERGVVDGTDRGWLDQHDLLVVVPATDHLAVPVDARAQAAAGDGITVGRRGQTGRHGQGQTAWTERLETAVVGMTGRTPEAQEGTAAHGRQAHRRDVPPHGLTAVGVRTWQGREYGPGGKPVFLTNAAVQPPLQPFDDDDARRLIEPCGLKEAKPPWARAHPPQHNERAVRGPVLLTRLLCALATADRWRCAPEAVGGEPVGWQRWRRQLVAQTRDQVIVWAQGWYGIGHLAECAGLMGVKLKDMPPGLGSAHEVLAPYGLAAHG
jgi:hypothetical protein